MLASNVAIIGAIGVAIAFCVVTGSNPLAPLVDVMARGKRLTTSTVIGGVVQESASTLAAQAAAVLGRDVSTEALALALMVRAEDGSAGQVAKVYKCHVAFNQAAALGWTIVELIQYHQTASRSRHFGEQISGRFASGRDCYENDLAAAEYAQSQHDAGIDPTFGAVNFVDRGGFGSQAGADSFAATVASWAGDGKVPGTLPATPDGLVFFWHGRVPAAAVEVVV